MACWVVPAIAAELWGVTVNHVLAGVRDGSIGSRKEHGFLFVDAAPGSYTYHRPLRPDEPRPPTFVPAAADEVTDALTDKVADELTDGPASAAPARIAEAATLAPVPPAEAFVEDDEIPPLDPEEDDTPLPPRDAIRAAVARQRRRPLAA